MTLRNDGMRAKEALLEVAPEIFAKYGYRKATNIKLCKACGLNPASVNYYFGSKENLYREAWKRAHIKAMESYPLDGGVDLTASPEARLYAKIASLLNMYTNKNVEMSHMVIKEQESRLFALEDLWFPVLELSQQMLNDIVDLILEGRAASTEVKCYSTSIAAMCQLNDLVDKGEIKIGNEKCSVNDMINHIYEFSLHALYSRRDELRAGKSRFLLDGSEQSGNTASHAEKPVVP